MEYVLCYEYTAGRKCRWGLFWLKKHAISLRSVTTHKISIRHDTRWSYCTPPFRFSSYLQDFIIKYCFASETYSLLKLTFDAHTNPIFKVLRILKFRTDLFISLRKWEWVCVWVSEWEREREYLSSSTCSWMVRASHQSRDLSSSIWVLVHVAEWLEHPTRVELRNFLSLCKLENE